MQTTALDVTAQLPALPANVDDAELSLIRVSEDAVEPALRERRSSRAFSAQPLPFETVRILFEAARFAPSAGNVQPWLFVYAHDRPTRQRAVALLAEEDQRWASRAPLLVFVFARRHHPVTGARLRTAAFDTGAAWFSLALQAQKLGLSCRAIGAPAHDRVYSALGVPKTRFELMIAIAIGHPATDQPASPRAATRQRQHHFVFNGRYAEPKS